jgi:hypothetical protein
VNDIEQKWTDYRLRVIPLNAPDFQKIECRRAYYAGAAAVIQMALHFTGQTAQEASRNMQKLRMECERYQAEVTAGRA